MLAHTGAWVTEHLMGSVQECCESLIDEISEECLKILPNVALDISLHNSYGCLALSMTISFLAPEYFIVFHSLRCLRFSFHFSTQPFHYYSLCLSLGSGSLSLNTSGNLIADFIWAPCHFHYIFHSYGSENFIVYFILMAWGFQWKFLSHTSVYFI